MAVVLAPVYTAGTWQWVHISHYVPDIHLDWVSIAQSLWNFLLHLINLTVMLFVHYLQFLLLEMVFNSSIA
jgi:hypothetical protein